MSKKVFNMQGGKHSAAAYTELEKWVYGSCVASLTSFVVSASTGMNLNISTGAGLISDTIARRIGTDAVEQVTVPAASASFNRIDSVVAYIDTAVNPTTAVTDNTNDILKFAVVAGTAASTPAAPTGPAILAAIGAGKPYMVLYDLLLPQNAANVSGITLTDRRKVIAVVDVNNIPALSLTGAKIANTTIDPIKMNGAAYPLFYLYANTTVTLANGALTKIPLPNKLYDVMNNANTSLSRFVAPYNGYYDFTGSSSYNSTSVTRGFQALMKNGAEVIRGTDVKGVNSYGSSVAGTIYLAAGDYVETVLYIDSSATTNSPGTLTSLSGSLRVRA